MELKEKELIKLKFGLCIQTLINSNVNPINHKSNVDTSITSLRKLAASSTIEYANIQKITSGKKNPELTTLVSLANGFNISLSHLFQYYDELTDDEVIEYEETLKKKRRERDNKKKNLINKKEPIIKKVPSKKAFSKKRNKK